MSFLSSQASRRSTTSVSDSNISEDVPVDQDLTLEYLQERMQQLIEKKTESQCCCCIMGGGGHWLSTLAATPGASSVLLEGVHAYDRASVMNYLQRRPSNFCSADVARQAARAACLRALHFAATNDTGKRKQVSALTRMSHAWGLACTSTLTSNTPGGSNSRAYLSAVSSSGKTADMYVTLTKDGHRSRLEEDVAVSHWLLDCWEQAMATAEQSEDQATTTTKTTTARGDVISTTIAVPLREPEAVVQSAAQQILDGHQQVVLLLPDSSNSKWIALTGPSTKLPAGSVILPGSFHPPHHGHAGLMRAAMEATASNNSAIAWFELSITNADKPSLAATDVVERIQHFWSLQDELPSERWGVLLTNAPLFTQKVSTLHPLLVQRPSNEGNNDSSMLSFVIGTDTFVRLVDPTYYDNSEAAMMEAIEKMPCRFVVGGRLAQKTTETNYVSGQQDVDRLPVQLQSKFTVLPDFRVDVSSSDIRAAKQKSKE